MLPFALSRFYRLFRFIRIPIGLHPYATVGAVSAWLRSRWNSRGRRFLPTERTTSWKIKFPSSSQSRQSDGKRLELDDERSCITTTMHVLRIPVKPVSFSGVDGSAVKFIWFFFCTYSRIANGSSLALLYANGGREGSVKCIIHVWRYCCYSHKSPMIGHGTHIRTSAGYC